jgi:hypothetical protein
MWFALKNAKFSALYNFSNRTAVRCVSTEMTWAKLAISTFTCRNQQVYMWLQGILKRPHKAICRPISQKFAAIVCENLYFHQIQSLATPFHRSEFITARPTSQLGSSVLALKLHVYLATTAVFGSSISPCRQHIGAIIVRILVNFH